jgi:hypothetical protein
LQKCKKDVEAQYIEDSSRCCEKKAEKDYHEAKEECHDLHEAGKFDDNELEMCLVKSKEAFGQALKECRPEPPTCWEEAGERV